MTRPQARCRTRSLGALSAISVVLAACAGNADVRTLSADAVGDVPPVVVATTVPDPDPPATTPEDDPRPDFTLPDLTLPERPPSTEPAGPTDPPASDTTEPDPAAPPERPIDDVAAAGDSLYPEVGNDGIDVEHYRVRIAYDPVTAVIDGEVTISLTADRALDELVLDAVGLEILDVRFAPWDSAGFDVTDDELVIDRALAAGAEVGVTVTYRASPTSDGGGFGGDVGWFATSTGAYVLNEPNGARLWMPADDHPGDKATWRFELTVPEDLAGVANGDQVAELTSGPGTTWIWEQREPMATYLVQLLIGDYQVIDGGMVGTTPIVNVALTEDVERMQPYFDSIEPQMEYFESVFGPYPLDRYGVAFTESFPGMAMETQGRSLFSAADFPGGTGPIGFFEELLLSHELAHQWFGDAVTLADWGDLWLNESFATYGQWLWFDHAGLTPIDESADIALEARQTPGEPTGTPSVDNLFGLERYDGGAVVLHALRAEIGDDAFFETLQRWVADNDGASRSTAAFVALAEEVADRPLTSFFDAWLFSATVPAAYPS